MCSLTPVRYNINSAPGASDDISAVNCAEAKANTLSNEVVVLRRGILGELSLRLSLFLIGQIYPHATSKDDSTCLGLYSGLISTIRQIINYHVVFHDDILCTCTESHHHWCARKARPHQAVPLPQILHLQETKF
jgi:hypothetical protein